MRLRFLTSSIAEGHDGVGDYTLRLARECRNRGHDSEIIAFNDRRTNDPVLTEDAARLPRAASWPKRLAALKRWNENRPAPDWTCLQFVPYGFHHKGFVHGWTERLQEIIAGSRLQIMFHEVWIGVEPTTPFRHKAMGALQSLLIKPMIQRLQPRVIHTSNEFYAAVLRRNGFPARVLPIFSGVPVFPGAGAARPEWPSPRAEYLLVGIFGTLHPVWPPEPLLSSLIAEAAKIGKKVSLVSLGRIGAGQTLWNEMQKNYSGRMQFIQLGELKPDEISQVLQELDFGIATSNYDLLGKSSVVAAMREHGTPVIVNRFGRDGEPAAATLPDDIITVSMLSRIGSVKRKPAASMGSQIVDRFLADLAECPSR